MAFDGWTEISGVCVHPDYRGQGMAQRLILDMCGRIEGSGKRPFLHTYADNTAAIRLYEHLGFDTQAGASSDDCSGPGKPHNAKKAFPKRPTPCRAFFCWTTKNGDPAFFKKSSGKPQASKTLSRP